MPLVTRSALSFLLIVCFTFGLAVAAAAQEEAASSQESRNLAQDQGTAPYRSLRCATPANPQGLHFECVGKPFDALTETLTKDFGEYRTALAKLGITATHSYTAQFMGSVSGGRSQGFTYAGTLVDLVSWDLNKFLGAPGLSFNVGASYASGRDLSMEHIGNVFMVQSAFNGKGNVNLQQMYLQQQFLSGALTVALGRLAPANTFATMPVLNNYLSGGISSVPASLGINDSAFALSPPGVEWGAQVIYNFTPIIQVGAGMFNTNPSAAAGKDNGVNFAFQQGNTGVLTVAQASYLHNQAPGNAGLPGEYTIGGLYNSNNFSSLSSPSGSVSNNYSLYAMFQQMVYRDPGPGGQKGLTVWGEAAISPKPSVSSMPYFLGGGLSYQGLIPGRGSDLASIGALYGSFSGYIPQTSGEAVIEVNYQITLTPWLSITPDFQYVMKPSGNSAIRNAAALGFQLAVTF
ncbi:MAG TPA: carbohydrate porin [Thermodesulfovibrionales bacterium]|jgi:porin|nr:carbohydrate porin [Thermodesulfovibrionales bacterium]